MNKFATVSLLVIGGIAISALVSFLLSWPVYMLWNACLVGAIDSIKEITWMQAWGINLLFSILFKNVVEIKK